MRPRGLIAISLLTAMSAGIALFTLGHVTSVAWALALTVLGVFWVLLPVALSRRHCMGPPSESHTEARRAARLSDGRMAPARR